MNIFIIFIISLIILFGFYKLAKIYLEDKKVEKDFISVVNHAFRTPLTRISWISKELEKTLNPNDERLVQLQGIDNATSKILNMVDSIVGIRDITKTSGYDFKVLSIREIIENSISKYREEINKKNIKFEILSFKNIPSLTLDLKKISYVIEEIIENAIEYSKNNDKILIEPLIRKNNVKIKITDSGIGLTMQDKIHIFSKFYRSKRAKLLNTDGIGLSLYLAKKIIKKHGGNIKALSNGDNSGTTIIIELPFNNKLFN